MITFLIIKGVIFIGNYLCWFYVDGVIERHGLTLNRN